MEDTQLKVRHIYEHQKEMFEAEVNRTLKEIVEEQHGVVGEIQYAIDASTTQNSRGGFGALIVYEVPKTG